MDHKIAELTEKIYKEGVEKGEEQAQQIIDDARAQADKIIADSRKQAEKIIADANAQAEELKRNMASEIKLSGQQVLAAIKQRILDVVTAKTVDTGVKTAIDDPAVMKDMIATIAQNWKAGANQEIAIDVLLAESKREELEKSLVNALQKALKSGVNVTFTRAIKSGFQIGPHNSSFKLSMTDEDFIELFKDFLRPKARAYLFGE